mmetsp:Transcript_1008/g.2888  ORF Transcript_1008/g.2888 Transcript_1008/m.2888 type:complete len:278 (+) Transcript_1008:2368-3201(+)
MASSTSYFSVLTRPQGMAVSQSRYALVTLNSAEFFSNDLNFANSSSMAARASFGIRPCFVSDFSSSSLFFFFSSSGSSRNSIFSSYFLTRASLSSCSTPSSFLMAFSCSCSMNVLCCAVIFSSTCLEISCCKRPSSRSLETSSSAMRNRSTTSVASNAFCNCSGSPVANAAAKSASLKGSPMSTRCVKKFMCSRYSGLTWTSSRIVATISFDRARTKSVRDSFFAVFLPVPLLRRRPVVFVVSGATASSPSSSKGKTSLGKWRTPKRGGGPTSTTVS